MTLNASGARVRCQNPHCGRLTKSVYPCKACGSVGHVVAIVRLKDTGSGSMADYLDRGRRKALREWRRLAQMKRGQQPYALAYGDDETDRATVIYDFDGDTLTVTLYPRKHPVRYPP